MTKVINLRKETYDVYIGRAGKGKDGYLGNPIVKGQECFVCGSIHELASETLKCFEIYFTLRLNSDEAFKKRVLSLKDKTLGCFCKPNPCHGDVIVNWLNENE